MNKEVEMAKFVKYAFLMIMKKLPCILLLSNLLLLSSEHNREYTKNTCHRTYWDEYLSTDKERAECSECSLSRLEVYDKVVEKHIAHIAYRPSKCRISYLLVDEAYRKEGIGKELANRAIEDMRVNHDCREISLISGYSAEKFWEKLGAKPRPDYTHVFPDPSSNDRYSTTFEDYLFMSS
jgi:GNAT superfamily N-acetyltransferase